jgi:hypothetical protein
VNNLGETMGAEGYQPSQAEIADTNKANEYLDDTSFANNPDGPGGKSRLRELSETREESLTEGRRQIDSIRPVENDNVTVEETAVAENETDESETETAKEDGSSVQETGEKKEGEETDPELTVIDDRYKEGIEIAEQEGNQKWAEELKAAWMQKRAEKEKELGERSEKKGIFEDYEKRADSKNTEIQRKITDLNDRFENLKERLSTRLLKIEKETGNPKIKGILKQLESVGTMENSDENVFDAWAETTDRIHESNSQALEFLSVWPTTKPEELRQLSEVALGSLDKIAEGLKRVEKSMDNVETVVLRIEMKDKLTDYDCYNIKSALREYPEETNKDLLGKTRLREKMRNEMRLGQRAMNAEGPVQADSETRESTKDMEQEAQEYLNDTGFANNPEMPSGESRLSELSDARAEALSEGRRQALENQTPQQGETPLPSESGETTPEVAGSANEAS